jgi:hypothetical protein
MQRFAKALTFIGLLIVGQSIWAQSYRISEPGLPQRPQAVCQSQEYGFEEHVWSLKSEYVRSFSPSIDEFSQYDFLELNTHSLLSI